MLPVWIKHDGNVANTSGRLFATMGVGMDTGTQHVTVVLSEEQAIELARWLCLTLYDINLTPATEK